jgi:tRNA (guanine37-N1)-methyltransferase
MRVHVVSIFPELLTDALRWGVIGRALERGQWHLSTFNPRTFAKPPHYAVDDRPYGGGPGMVMLHEPVSASIEAAVTAFCASEPNVAPRRILLSPCGARFDQRTARRLSELPGFVLVCGRYEGLDQRTVDSHIDEQLSVGDFVLSGGEFAALSVIDAVVRLLPGVLGDPQSAVEESFNFGLLDHPHFTRPETLADGRDVPSLLLSGDHSKIQRFNREQALTQTLRFRPDLLATHAALSPQDLEFLRASGYTSNDSLG